MDCGFDFCRIPGQYPNAACSFFSGVLFSTFLFIEEDSQEREEKVALPVQFCYHVCACVRDRAARVLRNPRPCPLIRGFRKVGFSLAQERGLEWVTSGSH